jgi:aminoglycoside 3-N-acetyltransferase
VSWEELWVEDDDFVEVVAAFIAAGGTRQTGTVGKATSQLLPIRPLVDFATKWFSTHRKHRVHGPQCDGTILGSED